MAIELMSIVLAVVTAAIYALSGWLKSAPQEELSVVRLATTMGLGLIIGVGLVVAGIPVNEAAVLEQMAIYAGLIVLIENVIKAYIRRRGS